jgi:hypothetical protein
MKRDIILAVVLIAIAVILYGIIHLTAKAGGKVCCYQDGKLIGEYDLSKEASYDIQTEYGLNTLVISGGSCNMTEADCPDKLCVNMKAISKNGESIVCLPHKLVVQIESDEESGLDAISR